MKQSCLDLGHASSQDVEDHGNNPKGDGEDAGQLLQFLIDAARLRLAKESLCTAPDDAEATRVALLKNNETHQSDADQNIEDCKNQNNSFHD